MAHKFYGVRIKANPKGVKPLMKDLKKVSNHHKIEG